MTDIFVVFLLLVLLFGCQAKFTYDLDGQRHQLVLNPSSEEAKP